MTERNKPRCTAYIENHYSHGRHDCTLDAGHSDDYHAGPRPEDGDGDAYCWSDAAIGAVPHTEASASGGAATEAAEPAYLALKARLELELKKTSAAGAQPAGPGMEDAQLAREGVAAGIQVSLAWAIHHFEGPDARAVFLNGEAGR